MRIAAAWGSCTKKGAKIVSVHAFVFVAFSAWAYAFSFVFIIVACSIVASGMLDMRLHVHASKGARSFSSSCV
jgi:hypothetical protein